MMPDQAKRTPSVSRRAVMVGALGSTAALLTVPHAAAAPPAPGVGAGPAVGLGPSAGKGVGQAVTLPSDSVGSRLFWRGDATGSKFFRIPTLLATRDGSLVAGIDANQATTGDSADNIDATFRRKPRAVSQQADAGWEDAVLPEPLHMRDYADAGAYAQDSASVIDGVLMQDAAGSGRIIHLIDCFAWNGGLFEHMNIAPDGSAAGGRIRTVARGHGFATVGGRSMLLLSTSNAMGSKDGKTDNINLNTDRTAFDLVADIHGPRDEAGRISVHVLEGTPEPAAPEGYDDEHLALGALTEYSLDENYVVHRHGEQLTAPQMGGEGGVEVPMRVFYKKSVLQVYNTTHVLQIHSDDDGRTWVQDGLITDQIKRPDATFCILGPGPAIQIAEGEHAGRLIATTYYQNSDIWSVEAIFSDDGGDSWTVGDPVPATPGISESVVVESSPGMLRLFLRHSGAAGGKVVTCSSTDGGMTWSAPVSALGDDERGVNCQVTAVALRQDLRSAETGEHLPAVVLVSADDPARVHGRLHIGVEHTDGVDEDGAPLRRLEWLGHHDVTAPAQPYGYSAIAQLQDGRVALHYESSPTSSWADGLQSSYYREYTLQELTTPQQR